jgi:hypothetical protein
MAVIWNQTMKPGTRAAIVVCGIEGLTYLVSLAVLWDLEDYDAISPLVALVIAWVVTWAVMRWYYK